MTKQSDEVTVEFLEAFAGAWNRHDVDELMSFMTDDASLSPQEERGYVVPATRVQKLYGVDMLNPEKISQMLSGTMPAIL
jgi:ketosteroid isomerase-like protein